MVWNSCESYCSLSQLTLTSTRIHIGLKTKKKNKNPNQKNLQKCYKTLTVLLITCISLCDVAMNEDFVYPLSNFCIPIVFHALNHGAHY